MARLLLPADLGIGPVEYQATIRLEGRTLHPDFLVTLAKVVVEVDGLDAHSSRDALDHDLDRQNLLIRHGFLVLRYTRTHLEASGQGRGRDHHGQSPAPRTSGGVTPPEAVLGRSFALTA